MARSVLRCESLRCCICLDLRAHVKTTVPPLLCSDLARTLTLARLLACLSSMSLSAANDDNVDANADGGGGDDCADDGGWPPHVAMRRQRRHRRRQRWDEIRRRKLQTLRRRPLQCPWMYRTARLDTNTNPSKHDKCCSSSTIVVVVVVVVGRHSNRDRLDRADTNTYKRTETLSVFIHVCYFACHNVIIQITDSLLFIPCSAQSITSSLARQSSIVGKLNVMYYSVSNRLNQKSQHWSICDPSKWSCKHLRLNLGQTYLIFVSVSNPYACWLTDKHF